jgi:DNA-binding GntR family transcriptional regulator
MALERSVERGDASWDASVLRRFDVMAELTARVEDPATAADDTARRRAASEAATAHWEFHDALYERCGSPWLLRFVKMLHSHAERYRRLSLQTSKARHLLDEHQAIMLAARNRDPGTAVDALRSHLNLTVQLLVESFGERSQEPAAAAPGWATSSRGSGGSPRNRARPR